MATLLATIKGIEIFQDATGRVYWTSAAAIDADGGNGQNGNPFSYRLDDKGLDALANAGYPDHGWRNVLIDDGTEHPVGDDDGNLYSKTTYEWKGRPLSTRYVDATAIPYIVVNPIVRNKAVGIVLGCRGRISFEGKSIDAVVADVSGPLNIGEISISAAKALGIKSSPRTGGTSGPVNFEFWPDNAAQIDGETYDLTLA